MSKFEWESVDRANVVFDPENGWLDIFDSESQSALLTKEAAINLASKLLQWGTSSGERVREARNCSSSGCPNLGDDVGWLL